MNKQTQITLTILVLSLLIQNCNEPNNIKESPPTWESLGLEGKHIKRLRLFKPYLYACAVSDGLWRKDIQTENSEWEYLGFSNTSAGQSLIYGVVDVVVHPENPDEILVAVFPDSVAAHGIFKSEDGGFSWFVSDSGMGVYLPEPYDDIFYIENPTLFLQTPDKLLAAGGSLAQSTDFGQTWNLTDPIVGQSSAVWTYSLTYHKENTHVLWLGASSMFGYSILLHSLDNCINWDYISLDSVVEINNMVYSIALDPSDADIAYVSVFYDIIKTTDGGASWTIIYSLEEQNGQIRSVVEDGVQSGHLFTAVENNVMETNDGGNTWTDLESPNGSDAFTMVYDSDEGVLYIGTENGSAPSGVFVYK